MEEKSESVFNEEQMQKEFPSNSFKSKAEAQAETAGSEKRIDPVVLGPVRRRKKPLGTKFRETFFSGDAREAGRYTVASVLVPAAKDLILDGINATLERWMFGDNRYRRSRHYGGWSGPMSPMSGPQGYQQYNRMASPSDRPPPAIMMNRRARARHDFDQIILQTRGEAEEVLDRMYDLLGRYDVVTVADLYELTNVEPTHVDQKWGWAELRGSGVERDRNGFLLNLPEPQPL